MRSKQRIRPHEKDKLVFWLLYFYDSPSFSEPSLLFLFFFEQRIENYGGLLKDAKKSWHIVQLSFVPHTSFLCCRCLFLARTALFLFLCFVSKLIMHEWFVEGLTQ